VILLSIVSAEQTYGAIELPSGDENRALGRAGSLIEGAIIIAAIDEESGLIDPLNAPTIGAKFENALQNSPLLDSQFYVHNLSADVG
jgi:hypothetical protein